MSLRLLIVTSRTRRLWLHSTHHQRPHLCHLCPSVGVCRAIPRKRFNWSWNVLNPKDSGFWYCGADSSRKSQIPKVSDDTLKGIKAIQQNCGNLNQPVQGSLSHFNFDRSAAGARAIVQWLEVLPQMYAEKGIGFLDSAGPWNMTWRRFSRPITKPVRPRTKESLAFVARTNLCQDEEISGAGATSLTAQAACGKSSPSEANNAADTAKWICCCAKGCYAKQWA